MYHPCQPRKYNNKFHLCVANSASRLTQDDLKTIQDLVWPARSKWFQMGIQLGIDVGTLEAIRGNNHDQSEDCFTDILTTWLRGRDPIPTWKSLVNALKSDVLGIDVILES